MNRYINYFIFSLLLAPIIRLIVLAVSNQLGANPVEFIIHSLGTWGLIYLLLTLTLRPLSQLIHSSKPILLRRTVGLFTFAYVCLHFLSYAGLDQWFDFQAIGSDIAKHPYVLVGFSGFLLMIPLAVTSTNQWMRRLGHRWKKLHRLVYLIAILGVVHYWWLVKKDISMPLLFSAILAVLLGYRLIPKLSRGWRREQPATDIIHTA